MDTSSPGWNPVTSLPTLATTPATSLPRTGRSEPEIGKEGAEEVRQAGYQMPDAAIHSSRVERTSTSSYLIWGLSMSLSSKTSSEPYLS